MQIKKNSEDRTGFIWPLVGRPPIESHVRWFIIIIFLLHCLFVATCCVCVYRCVGHTTFCQCAAQSHHDRIHSTHRHCFVAFQTQSLEAQFWAKRMCHQSGSAHWLLVVTRNFAAVPCRILCASSWMPQRKVSCLMSHGSQVSVSHHNQENDMKKGRRNKKNNNNKTLTQHTQMSYKPIFYVALLALTYDLTIDAWVVSNNSTLLIICLSSSVLVFILHFSSYRIT